jgi:alginate O-acetyltransferase complex protein AlgJ
MKEQTKHLWHASGLYRTALLLASLGGGTLAFLAIISRVYGFWLLSRWPRMLLLGMGAGLCSLILAVLLRSAWARLAAPSRAGKLAWLGAALVAGMLLKLLQLVPGPAMPLLYVLDIQTPGESTERSGPVVFMELRDYSGKPVRLVDLRKEGDWQPVKDGWAAQSDHPASLHYSFYAPPQGKIQLLFAEQPGAGQVQLVLDEKKQQVDLDSATNGQRLIDLPFQKQSRWAAPLFLADLVLMGFAYPLFLFLLPLYAFDTVRWTWPRLKSAAQTIAPRFDYSKFFIAIFVGICLLPFVNFKGDLSTINQFFGPNNPFWKTYEILRIPIFRDQFVGNALVSKGDWLIVTNENNLEDYQNTIPFTPEELYQIQQRIDGATQYLKEKGITLLIVVPPAKSTIYPDRLPVEIQKIGKQSRLEQVLEYQRLHGSVQLLDLRPALQNARKDHDVYYRTDSHWNPYGAYTAYVEIIQALGKDFPALKSHTLDEFNYTPSGEGLGDIGIRWAQSAQPEPAYSLTPLFNRQIIKIDQLVKNRVIYTYAYNQLSSTLPTAVVYHDSFMDGLAPFLSDHFSKAVYVRALDMENGMDEKLINGEKPNIVIYECTERLIYMLLHFSYHVVDSGK